LILETSQCPGQRVDYIEVVLSLCAILTEFYQRVMGSAEKISSGRPATLLTIDGCLTKRVVVVISQDMHNVALDLLREQQNDLATLFDSDLLLPTMFGKEPAPSSPKKVWTGEDTKT
jgi:hypothetical protein